MENQFVTKVNVNYNNWKIFFFIEWKFIRFESFYGLIENCAAQKTRDYQKQNQKKLIN